MDKYTVDNRVFISILNAENYIREKYGQPGKKIWFVPVAAFGIAYNAYIDDDTKDSRTFSMEHQISQIRYKYDHD
jgi:hypothetical protein